MKKIVLLTMRLSLFQDQIILNEMINAIMKETGNTGALVYFKMHPKAKPYDFQYFGNFKEYFNDDYLNSHSANIGTIIGLPNIDKLVSIEILSMSSSVKTCGHVSQFSGNITGYLQKHYTRKLTKPEIDTKIVNIFIEASFSKLVELAKPLRSMTFDLINITSNYKKINGGTQLGIYYVHKLVASEVNIFDAIPIENQIAPVPKSTFRSRIRSLFASNKLEKIHV